MQKWPTLEIPREGRAANIKYALLGAQGQEGPAGPAGFRDWEAGGGGDAGLVGRACTPVLLSHCPQVRGTVPGLFRVSLVLLDPGADPKPGDGS